MLTNLLTIGKQNNSHKPQLFVDVQYMQKGCDHAEVQYDEGLSVTVLVCVDEMPEKDE